MIPRLLSYFLLIAALLLTTAGGIYHGTITHRWGAREDVSAVADRLANVPESFGPWTLRESYPIAQAARDMLQCAGYLNRHYVHNETGESISVAILLGPAGPISVHTPEVCYSSRDFRQRADRQAIKVRDAQGDESEFWQVAFDSTGLEKAMLQTYYAWSDGDRWSANESPRMQYAGRPYLFKLQLAAMLPPDADLSKGDPGQRFLRDFVPVMNQYVFATK